MSELVPYVESNAATDLVAWADAASAAHRLATSLVKTAVCPKVFQGKPDEAAAVILLGAEVGMSPIASLRAMYPAPGGAVGMYAKAMAGLVVARGHVIWTEFESDDRVVVAGHRAGHEDHVERAEWTIARARQAGFIRRGPSGAPSQYETQPRTMLWSRAVAEIANKIAPDALRGIPEAGDEPLEAAANPGRVRVVQRAPLPAPEAAGREARGDATSGAASQFEPSDRPLKETVRASDADGVNPSSESPENVAVTPAENADDVADDAVEEDDAEPMLSERQRARILVELNARGIRDHDDRVAFLSRALEREVSSSSDLTATEAHYIIERFEALP